MRANDNNKKEAVFDLPLFLFCLIISLTVPAQSLTGSQPLY